MSTARGLHNWAKGDSEEEESPEDAVVSENGGEEPDEDLEDEDLEEEDDESAEDDDIEQQELAEEIEDNLDAIENCIDELDGEALTDEEVELEDADIETISAVLDEIDSDPFKEHIRGITFEAAQKVASKIADAAESHLLGAWLYRAGQIV